MNRKNIYIGCITITSLLLGSVNVSAQSEMRDSLIHVAFGQQAREDVVQAVSQVNVPQMIQKAVNNGSSLDGISSYIGGYNGNIWGQGALVMVDGVVRDASLVKPSEIETVTVLKDAAAVVLYGSRASKGVVLITTKRGKQGPMKIDVRANVGLNFPKLYPKYLDSDCYMMMYNEACRNDGKKEHYDAATIYNTHEGFNPYRYPNLDFFSNDYLRDFYTNTDLTSEVYGGNERTKYYLNLGINYNNSILKYGEASKNHDLNFNVRGNVDMTLTSWLKATTNAGFIYNDNHSGRGDFWGQATSLRPNWITPLLPVDMMDPNNATIQDYIATSNHLIDGKYLLGGTTSDQTNAFSELLAAGYTRQKYRKFLFDVTVTADLSSMLQGLSFKTAFSIDYSSHYSEAYAQKYAVYQPTWSNVNGKDMIIGLNKINEDKSSTNEYVGETQYDQTITFSSQFDYTRTFANKHNVSATLLGWGYQQQHSADEYHSSSTYHRTSNVNLGLRATYNYVNTYYFDFSGAYVHSAKLPSGKRNALSPTFTLGWRMSNEEFMRGIKSVDNLMLTASYANLHQDLDISDYYMYQGYYQFNPGSGWYQWADGTVGGSTSTSQRGSNPELGFITRSEFRVGLDATLFSKLLHINANYFTNTTNGLLTQGSTTLYPSFFNANGNFLPWVNYNEDKRSGLDFAVSANKKLGDFDVTLGVDGMVFTSQAKRRDERANENYLLTQGHALDASWGYVCEGFFADQSEIDAHAKQTFGGTVRPGDLKYKDINGDNLINSDDRVDIGKMGWSAAPFTFGINFTMKYKNFTFYARGNGQTGAHGFKNNAYWWNRGTSKFSKVVLNRWTPETASTATYPRLTTENGNNNYQNSTFWLYKTDQFRLTNVQLTYDLPTPWFGNGIIKGLKVYAGGNNLLTIAGEREYLEMNIGAPQYRTFYFGLKANF